MNEPESTPLVVIAPTFRTASAWLRGMGIDARDHRRVRLVLRADALRGMRGDGHTFIWLHGVPYGRHELKRLEEHMAVIRRSARTPIDERHIYT